MASEWIETTLGNICSSQGGSVSTGPFGSQLHASDYSDAGTPVVMPVNLVGGRVSENGIARVSSEHVSRLSRHRLSPGDIVFSRRGDVTRFALVSERERGWLCGTGCLKIHLGDATLTTPQFIAAYLSSPDAKEWLVRHAVGATMPNLNTEILADVPITLPPLTDQVSIGGFLAAIDHRIDLLRQTNATLEAIAQALFKSWFVDFDPVRAKAEGREPKSMDANTAALFPSEFEESELGLIPKGWSTASFGSVAQQCKGTVNPLQFPTTEFDHYSLPAFDAGRTPSIELGETIKSNKTPVPSNAVLISKLNPHIPRIWFVGDAKPGAVCSTEFLVWRPTTGLPAEYVYCLSSSPAFNSAMKQLVTGTSNSHQRVKPDHLNSIPVIAPPSAIAVLFGNIAGPILRRALQNLERANTLATLRDTLLPRLISGKLRLTEPDFQVAKSSA